LLLLPNVLLQHFYLLLLITNSILLFLYFIVDHVAHLVEDGVEVYVHRLIQVLLVLMHDELNEGSE
jgi:hypothetical protein